MSQFSDCIASARQQGMLSPEEADDLIKRWEKHRAAQRTAGEPDPDGAAKTALEGELDEAAARKETLAALTEEKHASVRNYITSFRDINGEPDILKAALNLFDSFGAGAGVVSIVNRVDGHIGLAHAEMADLLASARRSFGLGKRLNKPMTDDVVREILGVGTKSPEAKAMAEATSSVFEKMRERFNALGGNIQKLDYGYLPQNHNPTALIKAKFKGWHDFIVNRLDLDKMQDPITGGPMTQARLEEALPEVYNTIITGGWSKREPSAQPMGRGALANQRAEHRFLHFKTPDDWLAYNREFGAGDPARAIFEHINGMARDIAAMEVLGPNPRAMTQYLMQAATSEANKKVAGQPSLYAHSGSLTRLQKGLNWPAYRIESLHDYVRGRPMISGTMATAVGDVRNLLTGAYLGFSSIPSFFTDPVNDASARYLAGLPMTKSLGHVIQTAFSKQSKDQLVRTGLLLEDFKYILGNEARWAGTLAGSEWSRWFPDRLLTWNGLAPMTQARKHLHGADWMSHLADNADQSFDGLHPYTQRTFTDYGLTADDWDAMRAVPGFRQVEEAAPMLRPSDIAKVDYDLAVRYLGMIYGHTERAVPTGTARSRSWITGKAPRGTVSGEVVESGLLFKSFALSQTSLQWQAIQQELHSAPGGWGVARGAAYAGALWTALTMAGALTLQVRNLFNGKDLQDMTSGVFWQQAAVQGSGFGIAGDFLIADQNRFGGSLPATLLGPVAGLAETGLNLTVGNVQQAAHGKKAHFARELITTMGRNIPLVGHPLTRLGFQRMILDQLIYLTDPEAHKYFRAQEQRLKSETGQQFWWRPGQMEPSRAPDLEKAIP